jgi:DNA-binding CsgD family transcriptional regulator
VKVRKKQKVTEEGMVRALAAYDEGKKLDSLCSGYRPTFDFMQARYSLVTLEHAMEREQVCLSSQSGVAALHSVADSAAHLSPRLGRVLRHFLETLVSREDGAAAFCVLWAARVAAFYERNTQRLSDWYECVSRVPSCTFIAGFGLDELRVSAGDDCGLTVISAATLRSRLNRVGPDLGQLPLPGCDGMVLSVALRCGGEPRGIAAVSLARPLDRDALGWYAGCCDLFARTWVDDRVEFDARDGDNVCTSAQCPSLAARGDKYTSLSGREREIAKLLGEGYSTLNVASRLGLSECTVHTYTRRIYRKLGICNRAQLARSIRSADSTGTERRHEPEASAPRLIF